jgi:type II secretory pathway pseudopilin PulG
MTIGRKAAVIALVIFLLYITGQCLYNNIQLQRDNKRLVNSAAALGDTLTHYRDDLGREAAKSKTLELTLTELNKVLPEIRQTLKDLNIKPGRVLSFQETRIIQNKDIKQHLRDSIIFNRIPVKVFNYTDPWYQIAGIIQADTAALRITSNDTIIQVVSYGPRLNPWLWFLSRRQVIQTIQSRNPSNHIYYNRYIKIKR